MGLLNQSAVAGAESLAELKHCARLGKTFPVGWLAGWLAENEAIAQHSWGVGLAELRNIRYIFQFYSNHQQMFAKLSCQMV